jgi:hypothetical protein
VPACYEIKRKREREDKNEINKTEETMNFVTERIEDAKYRIPYRFGSVFLCVYGSRIQGYKFHYNVKKDNFFKILKLFIVPKRRTITVPVTF